MRTPVAILISIPIAAAGLMVLPAGCAQLEKLTADAATQAARGVVEYCKNTDQAFRARFQQQLNTASAPHTLAITCK